MKNTCLSPLSPKISKHRARSSPHQTKPLSRTDSSHVEEYDDPRYIQVSGVKGQSIFLELPSIYFPRSFCIDAMYCFYENIIPDMVNHLKGFNLLGSSSAVTRQKTKPKSKNNARTKKARVAPKNGSHQTKGADDNQEYDPYVIPIPEWQKIGADMLKTRTTLPVAFGVSPRDIEKYSGSFKVLILPL